VNFALPDQRGRTPVHVGAGFTLGERGGEQAHTLSTAEMPTHQHFAQAATVGSDTNIPAGNNLASVANLYSPPTQLVPLVPSTIGNVGGSQAHLNMQPFLTLTFCIALQGIFPSPN
jgi:microcystin-dependent protein